MANFNTHLNGALAVSGTASLILYKAGLVDDTGFLLCTLLGTIGGLLPDLDSDHSTPIKLGFNIAALIVAFALVMHWRSEANLITLMLLWLAGYVLIRYAVFSGFTKMTVHRGIIHSVPYMAILGLGLVYINVYSMDTPLIKSWLYGAFLFFGAMVHLTLDELYSVDLSNMRVKRSFGTAIKFFQFKDKWWYIGLYAILAVLIYFAPPFLPFWERMTNPAPWLQLKDHILPVMIQNLLY